MCQPRSLLGVGRPNGSPDECPNWAVATQHKSEPSVLTISSGGWPVMHVTFGPSTYSMIKVFSFSPASVERFSGLGRDCVLNCISIKCHKRAKKGREHGGPDASFPSIRPPRPLVLPSWDSFSFHQLF